MTHIHRIAYVACSAEHFFDLVHHVEYYPKHFPWCKKSLILQRNTESMRAQLHVTLAGMPVVFTTDNNWHRPAWLGMKFVDGPFESLQGQWCFYALQENACKVEFTLDFQVRSGILAAVLAKGFKRFADQLVNDFVRVACIK